MSVVVRTLADVTADTSSDGPLDTQEYFVNMGPQHPATHGVLRVVLKLDGEVIRELHPVLGYIHRGIEKMCEHMTYRQAIHLTDRMDYLSSLMNNWAISAAIEKAAEIELNERIETIRTIVSELERLQSHQLWWGVVGLDLGAFTPFLHGFRDREQINDILEETVGARLTMNYILPGGVMYDVHPNFVKRVKDFLAYFKPKLEEYHDLLSNNVILQERFRNVGVLDAETAISYGATGPTLRASGVPYDLRKVAPYGVYDKVEFAVPVGTIGDSWDRYSVRLEEMRESIRIIEQLIDNIPEGKNLTVKMGAKIKLPEGKFYSQLETARGVLGVFIQSTGGLEPHRMHFRSPNFNTLWTLRPMCENHLIGSFVATMSSIDLVIPDIDR
jgi:NADH-quinone oxidoreductase subunit D